MHGHRCIAVVAWLSSQDVGIGICQSCGCVTGMRLTVLRAGSRRFFPGATPRALLAQESPISLVRLPAPSPGTMPSLSQSAPRQDCEMMLRLMPRCCYPQQNPATNGTSGWMISFCCRKQLREEQRANGKWRLTQPIDPQLTCTLLLPFALVLMRSARTSLDDP